MCKINLCDLQQRDAASLEKKLMRKITQQQETEMKQFLSQQKKDYQKSKDSIKKVCKTSTNIISKTVQHSRSVYTKFQWRPSYPSKQLRQNESFDEYFITVRSHLQRLIPSPIKNGLYDCVEMFILH